MSLDPTEFYFYVGSRSDRHDARVVKSTFAKTVDELDPRRDLANHSPTGFNWGYSGSGPAQLALAILADALQDDERALRLHQAYKFKVISNLRDNWSLSKRAVIEVADQLDQEREDANGKESG
jgi:hypothetical protein